VLVERKEKSIKILCSVTVHKTPNQADAAFEPIHAVQDCARSSFFGQRGRMCQRQRYKPLEGDLQWGEEKKLGLQKEILFSRELGRGSVCNNVPMNHPSSRGSKKQRER